jgi:hypothetical protein
MVKINPVYENYLFLNGDFKSFQEDENTVFVLMPFGKSKNEQSYFMRIFQSVKNITENVCFGGGILKCSRADLENDLVIMNDVCHKIKKANLTIFDISTPNLNVFFELGLACALDKKMILIYNHSFYYEKHPNERLPIDINQFRYVPFIQNSELESILRQKLEYYLKYPYEDQINFAKVYEKICKLTRHFQLDTLSEQIKEDFKISDYEIRKASDVLNEYWRSEKDEWPVFRKINYDEVSSKIFKLIGSYDHDKIKHLLRYMYWRGLFSPLIAQLYMSPAELWDCKVDFEEKLEKFKQKKKIIE